MSVPAAIPALRADLLRQADALRDGKRITDPDRFDALLTDVESLDAVSKGTSTEAQRTRALELLAEHDRTAPGPSPIPAGVGAWTRTPHEDVIAPMAEAIVHRYLGGPLSERARPYRSRRLLDFARELLEHSGQAARHQSDAWVATRAVSTTSMFPELLQATGNRVLLKAYETAPSGIREIARQTTARDFRPLNKLNLGHAPALLEVREHGEITRGQMAETKESYRLATYARIFGLTRQAIINDDLSAFMDFTRRQGQAAAELIAAKLAALLTGNPVMGDGVALFHATHKNLGTAGAIDLDALAEALALMRTQAVPMDDGPSAPANITPRYLVVPAALEVLAKQHVALINATKAADVNPFAAELQVVVDPRLDVVDDDAWYLAADPAVFDTLEYAFLEDAPGPQYSTREGFDVLGLEMRVTLDFGCAALDYRGLVKNAGGS
jgi:hypothetical protein